MYNAQSLLVLRHLHPHWWACMCGQPVCTLDLNVCIPSRFRCWNLTPVQWCLEVGPSVGDLLMQALPSWMEPVWRPQGAPLLFLSKGWKASVHEPGSRLFPDPESAGTLTLDFPEQWQIMRAVLAFLTLSPPPPPSCCQCFSLINWKRKCTIMNVLPGGS